MRLRKYLLATGLLVLALAAPSGGVAARAEETGGSAFEVKVPQTAAEHLAMAETYKKKAADYRKDAESHREMLADYKKGVAISSKGPENPWLKRMRVHCEGFINDAERLAKEADAFADYHTKRGQELQGK